MADDVWAYSALYQTCVAECAVGGWEAPEALDAGTVAALRALATAEAPPWHAIFTLPTTKTLHPALAALTDADLADLVRVIDAHGFPVAWAHVVREEAGVRHGLLPRGMLVEALRRFDVARTALENELDDPVTFPYALLTGAHTPASAPWLECIQAGLWRPPAEGECVVSVDGTDDPDNWSDCPPLHFAVALGYTHLLPRLCTLPVPHMSWRVAYKLARDQSPTPLDVIEWLHEQGHWPAGEVKYIQGPLPAGPRGAAGQRLVDKGVVTVLPPWRTSHLFESE